MAGKDELSKMDDAHAIVNPNAYRITREREIAHVLVQATTKYNDLLSLGGGGWTGYKVLGT